MTDILTRTYEQAEQERVAVSVHNLHLNVSASASEEFFVIQDILATEDESHELKVSNEYFVGYMREEEIEVFMIDNLAISD